MVGASKILTVSYGTFSCTLEGFDDPFNTMKAIAEYFRDLAADDRYFGAEPPQPDAAMLHRIAEREVQRRVEARIEDNGVVLRAGGNAPSAPDPSPMPAAPPVRATPAPQDAPLSRNEAPPAGEVSDSVAAKLQRLRQAVTVARASGETTRPPQSLAALLAAAEIEEADTASESEGDEAARVAAEQAETERLATEAAEAERIAAEQAEAERLAAEAAEAERIAAEQAEAERLAAEAVEAERIAAEQADAERLAAEAAEAERIAAEQAEADRLAAEAAAEIERLALLDENLDDEITGGAPQPATDDTEEEDALLARFLDDSPEESARTTADDGFEDEIDLPPGGRFDDEADRALIAALSAQPGDAESAVEDPDNSGTLQEASAEAVPEAQQDNILPTSFGHDFAASSGEDRVAFVTEGGPDTGAAFGETAQDDESADAITGTEVTGSDAADTDIGDGLGLDDAVAETLNRDSLEGGNAVAGPAPAGSDDPAPFADPAPAQARDDQPQDSGEQTGSDQPEASDATDAASLMDRAKQARARVIRIRRVDAPARPEALPTVTEGAPEAGTTGAEAAPVQPRRPVMPRRPRNDAAQDEDASVKRLIDQTNTELDGPENRRRLSAIAHLKAAVAATVADRKAGVETRPSDETRIGPYRTDLERAMRPRAAQPGDQPVAPPAERPAPLVLVSAQRIDRPESARPADDGGAPAQVTPIRPHRVTGTGAGNLAMQVASQDDEDEDVTLATGTATGTGTIFDAQPGFAEFAEALGAESLADLLEAATAYALCSEGQDSVTRPQIVRHVADLRPDLAERREDVLSVFGTLLREGRIEKVSRGQFTLNGDAPALAEGRKRIEGTNPA